MSDWITLQGIAQLITAISAPLVGAFAAWQFARRDTDKRRLSDLLHQVSSHVTDFHLSLIAYRSHLYELEVSRDALRLPTRNVERIWETQKEAIRLLRWVQSSSATVKADGLQLKMQVGDESEDLRVVLRNFIGLVKDFSEDKNPTYAELKSIDYSDKVETIDSRISTLWTKLYGPKKQKAR